MSIALAKKYVDLLDEVYQTSAKTSVLDSDMSMARAGASAREIVIPKISLDGLGDYDRNTGYATGSENLAWETKEFNYERGRMFTIDAMDDEETLNIAFGKLAGEFIRTKVVPEIDAFRFSKYSAKAIAGGNYKAEDITSSTVVSAIRNAINSMDEAEVYEENRYLFITPTLKAMIDDLDTTKSKAILDRFAQVIVVPSSRFATAITLNDGKTSGQTAGGFVKTAGGHNINFLAVDKKAVLQITKHAVPKIITPEQNQDADAYKYGYRNYGLAEALDNKAKGIYVSYVTTANT